MWHKFLKEKWTMRWCLPALLAVFLVMPLLACDKMSNHLHSDRDGELDMQDFRDGLAARDAEVSPSATRTFESSVPALQPYVASVPDNLKNMPLVSISVNQTVPLKDVLFELAEQAGYDLELDPNIRGSIIFTVRQRPFDTVIERICDLSGLRYSFKGDVLRVEIDTPYNKVYKISYLSFIRTNEGSIRNSVNVVSGDGADTGSDYSSTVTSEADFWGELEANLTQILNSGRSTLKTRYDPQITAMAQTPNVQAVGNPNAENVQPPQASLQVQSLPVDSASESAGEVSESELEMFMPKFVMNRQAGLVNVYATERMHKEVDSYLKELKKAVTAQVLIEAKILEVELNDQFRSGIDWRVLDLFYSEGVLGFNGLTGTSFGALDTVVGGGGSGLSNPLDTTLPNFVVGYAGNDFQALIGALSTFGTTRALASPRVTVLNNQSAVLNVATNKVFFEIDIDVTTDTGTTTTDIDSSIRNVPEGVLVNVQPSIDLDTGLISMAVRPTVTSIGQTVQDPAVAFLGVAGVSNLIPEVNVQEIDSVIQVRSGQAVVMGGLLQDNSAVTQNGVPILGEMPMVGGLFRNSNNTVNKTELVIFLKATIIENPRDTVDATDRDVYRKFSQDRRPLKL